MPRPIEVPQQYLELLRFSTDCPDVGPSFVACQDIPAGTLVVRDQVPYFSYPHYPRCRSSASPFFTKALWQSLCDITRRAAASHTAYSFIPSLTTHHTKSYSPARAIQASNATSATPTFNLDLTRQKTQATNSPVALLDPPNHQEIPKSPISAIHFPMPSAVKATSPSERNNTSKISNAGDNNLDLIRPESNFCVPPIISRNNYKPADDLLFTNNGSHQMALNISTDMLSPGEIHKKKSGPVKKYTADESPGDKSIASRNPVLASDGTPILVIQNEGFGTSEADKRCCESSVMLPQIFPGRNIPADQFSPALAADQFSPALAADQFSPALALDCNNQPDLENISQSTIQFEKDYSSIYIPGIPAAFLGFLTYYKKPLADETVSPPPHGSPPAQDDDSLPHDDDSLFYYPSASEFIIHNETVRIVHFAAKSVTSELAEFQTLDWKCLAKFTLIIYANAHTVWNPSRSTPTHSRKRLRKPKMCSSRTANAGTTKIALFFLGSKFAHSCSPNLLPIYKPEEQSLSFFSIRNIKKDEVLTFSYLPLSDHDCTSLVFGSKAERAAALWRFKFFECRCDRCNGCESQESGVVDKLAIVAASPISLKQILTDVSQQSTTWARGLALRCLSIYYLYTFPRQFSQALADSLGASAEGIQYAQDYLEWLSEEIWPWCPLAAIESASPMLSKLPNHHFTIEARQHIYQELNIPSLFDFF